MKDEAKDCFLAADEGFAIPRWRWRAVWWGF